MDSLVFEPVDVVERGPLDVFNIAPGSLATATGPRRTFQFHQSSHGAVRDVNIFTIQLLPDFLGAVNTIEVAPVHPHNLGFKSLVAALSRTQCPRLRGVVSAGGELQYWPDRLDSPSMLTGLDVTNYRLV